MVRIFSRQEFLKWASRERLSDEILKEAAVEAFSGHFEADLGGYLFKKRIARTAGGKSGGYRTILGFRRTNGSRIFFLYGFAKNERSEIYPRELKALRLLAKQLVDITDEQIEILERNGSLKELGRHDKAE